ncbi:MAG: adenylate/guanylate cyclase domain-containing protein [Aeromicrobium sp.]
MSRSDALSASFEREFARAILALERLRVTLAMLVLIALTAVLLVVFVVEDAMLSAMFDGVDVRYWSLLAVGLGVPFLLLLRRRVDRCLADETALPVAWRVASVLVEASVPTVFIVVFTGFLTATEALSTPPTMGYFIVLILTILSLHPGQCALSGLVAAGQYLALSLWFRAEIATDLPGTIFSVWPPYVMRAVILLCSGLMAAVVAREVRRRVELALRSALERDHVLDVFGQHVSPEVVDTLLSQPAELGPEVRRVCVMFVDIRDFTRFSARRSPQEVVDYLNALFGPLSDVVARHRGIINKFLGDGFMAVFGAPLADPDAERHAVAAARELIDTTGRLQQAGTIPATVLGIGLHAGVAVTGTVGSSRRKEYTIIGDTVNLAARIEQLNKVHGSRILASEDVVAALGDDARGEPLPPTEIRGRDQPVKLYRLA